MQHDLIRLQHMLDAGKDALLFDILNEHQLPGVDGGRFEFCNTSTQNLALVRLFPKDR